MKTKTKTNNLVAKHAKTYNKAAIHLDRKKAMKAGKAKHQKPWSQAFHIKKKVNQAFRR